MEVKHTVIDYEHELQYDYYEGPTKAQTKINAKLAREQALALKTPFRSAWALLKGFQKEIFRSYANAGKNAFQSKSLFTMLKFLLMLIIIMPLNLLYIPLWLGCPWIMLRLYYRENRKEALHRQKQIDSFESLFNDVDED